MFNLGKSLALGIYGRHCRFQASALEPQRRESGSHSRCFESLFEFCSAIFVEVVFRCAFLMENEGPRLQQLLNLDVVC